MNHILLDPGIILAVLGIVYALARRDPATALAAILGAHRRERRPVRLLSKDGSSANLEPRPHRR
jgi:hypothetical protein